MPALRFDREEGESRSMNATSLYVSTCRLVLQAEGSEQSSWTDLYRLLPYLRQSLSCTVCSNLLIEPFTPTESNCQHHVCRACRGGKKKLKPSCSWCRDYDKYMENVQLRILLQCYKKLCEYVTSTPIFRQLGAVVNANGLVDLIQEGAGFKDEYKSNAGLSKSAYSILPFVYSTNTTSTQTPQNVSALPVAVTATPQSVSPQIDSSSSQNGSSLYSVMYAGSDSTKITIKRKLAAEASSSSSSPPEAPVPVPENSAGGGGDSPFRRSKIKTLKPKPKKKGCRCGNATPTPGKLTCCGQRCPCYVEAKACLECRCRGCRNPHRPGGKKVRPHIPPLQNIQVHVPTPCTQSAASSVSLASFSAPAPQPTATLLAGHPTIPLHLVNLVHTPSSIYTTANMLSVQNVSSVVPAALLVGDEKSSSNSNSDNSDVDIDG